MSRPFVRRPARPLALLVLSALLALLASLAAPPMPAAAKEIHDAINAGDLEAVRALLEKDAAAITCRDEAWSTPLHVALGAEQAEIALLLIEKGAELDAGDADDSRPLHWAALNGMDEVVAALIAGGADVDAEEDYGNTALAYAAYGGRTEAVRRLLAAGADAGHANTSGAGALHFAARNEDPGIVKLLVEGGADVNLRDSYGLTPLFMARSNERPENVAYLTEQGATADFEIGPAEIELLRPGIHLLTVPFYNEPSCVVQSGPDGLLLVDTGFRAAADRIKEALASLGGGKVAAIISSHQHGDHTGAHPFVDSTATVIDLPNLEQHATDGLLTLAESGLTGRGGHAFEPHYVLRFNDEEIRIIPVPGPHSDSDVLVWFTRNNVVCTGATVVSEAWPAVRAGQLERFFEILDTMLDVFPDDALFVPAHGRPVNRSGLVAYRRMATESVKTIRAALASGRTVSEMLTDGVLVPWSEYDGCDFMPYQTARLWLTTVQRTVERKE